MTVLDRRTGGPPSAGARPDPLSAARALAVAAASAVLLVAIYLVFVRTSEGQHLDQSALNHLGGSRGSRETVSTVLDITTIGAMTLVLAACILVALARRRWSLAVGAVALVGMSNLVTELLKHQILTRPDLGYGDLNSFPSGHTTVAASITMAALLVVPRGARWLVAVAGSVSVAVTGVGTVVAGWHRPSDVVAALLVTLAVAAAVLVVLTIGHGTEPGTTPAARPLVVVTALPVAAAVLLALGVRPDGTTKDLVVHIFVMGALATVSTAVLALYTRMVDTRFR
jgi:membrane-associated phospholipid phosphatase